MSVCMLLAFACYVYGFMLVFNVLLLSLMFCVWEIWGLFCQKNFTWWLAWIRVGFVGVVVLYWAFMGLCLCFILWSRDSSRSASGSLTSFFEICWEGNDLFVRRGVSSAGLDWEFEGWSGAGFKHRYSHITINTPYTCNILYPYPASILSEGTPTSPSLVATTGRLLLFLFFNNV